MKKIILFVPLCAILFGCASLETVRSQNRTNLMRLSTGMPKVEVLQVMGIETVSAEGYTINNPYRSETMQGKEKVLEVLYYYTDIKKRDGAITDDELTPLVFDSGKLTGWGWSFLQDNSQKYEIRLR